MAITVSKIIKYITKKTTQKIAFIIMLYFYIL
jgi:hypothetical protein